MHPDMMSLADTGLLVVDIQEKLVPFIWRMQELERNAKFMIDVANELKLPILATEQYPQGLGATISSIASKLSTKCPTKVTFSCCGNPEVVEFFQKQARPKVLVIGMETHVCVAQTVFDLLAYQFRVYVAVDAVSCRYEVDHDVAIRRMEKAGAILTTVEAAAFELMRSSTIPSFKAVSKLVQGRMKEIGSVA